MTGNLGVDGLAPSQCKSTTCHPAPQRPSSSGAARQRVRRSSCFVHMCVFLHSTTARRAHQRLPPSARLSRCCSDPRACARLRCCILECRIISAPRPAPPLDHISSRPRGAGGDFAFGGHVRLTGRPRLSRGSCARAATARARDGAKSARRAAPRGISVKALVETPCGEIA
jgi:hypothetical protein